MHQGQKKSKERQEKIQQILEEFKGINNILNISAKKKTLIPKLRDEKGTKPSHPEQAWPMSSGNSKANSTPTRNRTRKNVRRMRRGNRTTRSWKPAKNLTKRQTRKKLKKRIQWRRVQASVHSRNKKCRLPVAASDKEKLETVMDAELKTSRDAMKRRRR